MPPAPAFRLDDEFPVVPQTSDLRYWLGVTESLHELEDPGLVLAASFLVERGLVGEIVRQYYCIFNKSFDDADVYLKIYCDFVLPSLGDEDTRNLFERICFEEDVDPLRVIDFIVTHHERLDVNNNFVTRFRGLLYPVVFRFFLGMSSSGLFGEPNHFKGVEALPAVTSVE